MGRDHDVHVTPKGGGWSVQKEGKRGSKKYATKKEAVEAGRAMAQKARAHHVIHGRDGRIQQRDSYGTDPFPTRDDRGKRGRLRLSKRV